MQLFVSRATYFTIKQYKRSVTLLRASHRFGQSGRIPFRIGDLVFVYETFTFLVINTYKIKDRVGLRY